MTKSAAAVLFAFASLAGQPAWAAEPASRDRPNIILCMTDDKDYHPVYILGKPSWIADNL